MRDFWLSWTPLAVAIAVVVSSIWLAKPGAAPAVVWDYHCYRSLDAAVNYLNTLGILQAERTKIVPIKPSGESPQVICVVVQR